MKGAYNITFSLIDKGLLEYIGPTGAGKVSYRLGTLFTRLQTGNVSDYAAFMLTFLYLAIAFDGTALFFTPLVVLTRTSR